MHRILLIFLLQVLIKNVYALYENTDTWKTAYAQYCNGNQQSPIEITTDNAKFSTTLKKPVWTGTIPQANAQFTVKNDGKSIYVDAKMSGTKLTTTAGEFILDGYHLHWSNVDSGKGSEHVVNGIQYPLEVHFVHYNTKYGSVGGALANPDGLTVIGVLFKEEKTETSLFEKILPSDLTSLQTVNGQTLMPAVNIAVEVQKYITFDEIVNYKGSLTTPNCNEVVDWWFKSKPIYVKSEQLSALRKVAFAENDKFNYRALQPLNNRAVTRNFEGTVSKGQTKFASSILSSMVVIGLAKFII